MEHSKWMKPGADPEARLAFWREMNDYAIKARGESARSEYKVLKEDETP